MVKSRLNKRCQLRIIAGKWRGRKLAFPDIEGLRPTPDRVRETVFNWLQPYISYANCLDLFAGSGALGFEAASRGASRVVMVEQSLQASKKLREHCDLLVASQCQIEYKTAQQFLENSVEQFDIVFVDPPYQADLWTEIAHKLEQTKSLAEDALIYLEVSDKITMPELPDNWHMIKDKKAGEVRYCLFRYGGE